MREGGREGGRVIVANDDDPPSNYVEEDYRRVLRSTQFQAHVFFARSRADIFGFDAKHCTYFYEAPRTKPRIVYCV